MRRSSTLVLIGLLVLFTSAACGGGRDPAAAKLGRDGEASQPKASKDTSTVSGGDGAKIPADFPKADVPLPPDGQIVSASSFMTNGAKTWVVIMKVSDDASKVATDYQHALARAGYTVKDTVNLKGLLSTYATVGSKYDVRVAGSGERASRTNPPGLIVTVSSHGASAAP
jgi:hypothetical protein